MLRRNRNRDSCEKNVTGTENTGIRRIPAGITNHVCRSAGLGWLVSPKDFSVCWSVGWSVSRWVVGELAAVHQRGFCKLALCWVGKRGSVVVVICLLANPCQSPLSNSMSHFDFCYVFFLNGRSVGQLVGWLVGWLVLWSVGQSVGRSVRRLVGRLVGRPVCRSFGWLVGRLVGRIMGWSVGRSVSGLVGQLVGRRVGRTVGRSGGWLVGWSIGWSVSRSVGRLVNRSVGQAVGR
jgi:hypothetical protein